MANYFMNMPKVEGAFMLTMLECCSLCPRNCNVNRLKGQVGFCKSSSNLNVARVSLHQWEEPCISGTKGSGTVFFSNCNLSCVFCQNHEISQEHIGKNVSIERLSKIFIEQEMRGAHNINLVTPTHFVPQIIEAIKLSKKDGLSIPILYNSNGYENIDTIKALSGHIDIYLPDLKYMNDKYAEKYSKVADYFKFASPAIDEMVLQHPKPIFNTNGIMLKGVIIRHLMLPGLLFDSKKIVDYIYNKYGDNVYLSLMNQYTPMFNSVRYPEINKPLNPKHYQSLVNYCQNLGFKNCFIQEDGTVKESFVPHFDLTGV